MLMNCIQLLFKSLNAGVSILMRAVISGGYAFEPITNDEKLVNCDMASSILFRAVVIFDLSVVTVTFVAPTRGLINVNKAL